MGGFLCLIAIFALATDHPLVALIAIIAALGE